MTPRQISGHVIGQVKLENREKADRLWIAAHASRANKDKIEKIIKDWTL